METCALTAAGVERSPFQPLRAAVSALLLEASHE
jgi:hypothetical protein